MLLCSYFVDHLLLGMGTALRPSDTTNFSSVSGSQLEIASRLGMGACVSIPLSARTPCLLDFLILPVAVLPHGLDSQLLEYLLLLCVSA